MNIYTDFDGEERRKLRLLRERVRAGDLQRETEAAGPEQEWKFKASSPETHRADFSKSVLSNPFTCPKCKENTLTISDRIICRECRLNKKDSE